MHKQVNINTKSVIILTVKKTFILMYRYF